MRSGTKLSLDKLQFAGLIFMVVAMPISNGWMSLATFFLSGVFLALVIRDKSPERFYRFFQNRGALVFSSLFFVFGISLLWTDDWTYGLKDLRTKLPILIMPLLLGGLNPVSQRQLRIIFGFFIGALVYAVTVCLLVYTGHYNQIAPAVGMPQKTVQNIRDISIFISHVRFSLLLVFGVLVLWNWFSETRLERLISLVISGYFIFFLWILESMTGIGLLFALLLIWIVYKVWTVSSRMYRMTLLILLPAFLLGSAVYLVRAYSTYFTAEEIDLEHLDEFTPYGEKYEHFPWNSQLENGHYIMIYIAWGELADEWSKRSAIPFEGKDSKGNLIKGTLIRYLTSRGLRKDRDGVRALTDDDIRQIEEGIPSALFNEKNGISRRLDKIFFEYDAYRNGVNPSGHSVFQRLEFWRAARWIINRNFWAGVGVGDVKSAYREAYEQLRSPLDEEHRLRAHNQYLTAWITSGIGGFILFLIIVTYPLIRAWKEKQMLYLGFMTIVLLSFLTEDTLESQAGVTFYVFISGVFLFLPRSSESPS